MTKREIVEGVFTILTILSLWPLILGWSHPIYSAFLGVMVVTLCVLLFGKFRRIRQESDRGYFDARNRPPGPPNLP